MFLLTGGLQVQGLRPWYWAMGLFPQTFSFRKINSQSLLRQKVFEGPETEPLMKMIQDGKLHTT